MSRTETEAILWPADLLEGGSSCFEVAVSHEGTVRTIGLIGEFDLEALPEVADVLSASLSDGSSSVQIDLQGLTFLDSSGIRALLMALRESETAGTTLTIIPGPPNVQRVFEVAGLLDVLPFRDPAVS